MSKNLTMKTQNHIKVKALSNRKFQSNLLSRELRECVNLIKFDKDFFFDTDLGYSYLMDYISLLKVKKRTS
jgi:hypothetical protein